MLDLYITLRKATCFRGTPRTYFNLPLTNEDRHAADRSGEWIEHERRKFAFALECGSSRAAMASRWILGVHLDRCRCGRTSHFRTGISILVRAPATGRTGWNIRIPRSSHVGAHTSRTDIRVDCAVRSLSPLFTSDMARALAVSAWSNCGPHRLRDQRVLHWRMDRALCGSLLQHPILFLPWPGLAIQSARPANAEEALAHKSHRRPSRNCNDAAGDGRLLCH